MLDELAVDNTSLYAPREPSTRGIWALVLDTFALYLRFWKEFLLASGSVTVGIWVLIAVSIALGHDLRDIWYVEFLLGVFAVYYAIVLLTALAGEAGEKGTASLWRVYRRSWLGVITSTGVLLGIALVMAIVLIVPLLGLVAALYLFVRLSAAFDMAILEQANPLKALRRAWTLTKGRFWRVLMEAILQNAYLFALVAILALLPNAVIVAVLFIVVGLPPFAIFRVLGYLDLLNRERLQAATDPYRIA